MSAATTGTAFLRFKKLKGNGIITVAARHNRRELQAEMGATDSIDPTHSQLNETLQGPSTAAGVGMNPLQALTLLPCRFSSTALSATLWTLWRAAHGPR
jgi:hypothetical protein